MLRSKLFCRLLCLMLACALLGGCALVPGSDPAGTEAPSEPVTETAEPTRPGPTAPPDGDPEKITARGSYTGAIDPDTVVAIVGTRLLTQAQLQLYYGLAIADWRTAGYTPAPDWNEPLDVQRYPLGGDAVTWQQFFLQRALNTWHLHAALVQHSTTATIMVKKVWYILLGSISYRALRVTRGNIRSMAAMPQAQSTSRAKSFLWFLK